MRCCKRNLHPRKSNSVNLKRRRNCSYCFPRKLKALKEGGKYFFSSRFVVSLIDTVRGQLILSSRVKSAFLHLTLKVGYNLRKFGMTLSGRSYITFLQLPVESCAARLTAVSVGQVKSKDVPCSDD